jgi:hypothetical protein
LNNGKPLLLRLLGNHVAERCNVGSGNTDGGAIESRVRKRQFADLRQEQHDNADDPHCRARNNANPCTSSEKQA